jgi:hypothetical protein
MRFRKLRIAWSVVCGILCLLLTALWVRSYLRWDVVCQDKWAAFIAVSSSRGYVQLVAADNPLQSQAQGWTISRRPLLIRFPRFKTNTGFAWSATPNAMSLTVPHWLLVLCCLLLSTTPWIHWRFSLRTLLIATALVAGVLGLLMAAV